MKSMLDEAIRLLADHPDLVAAVRQWHTAAEAEASRNAKGQARQRRYRERVTSRVTSPKSVTSHNQNPKEINGRVTSQPPLVSKKEQKAIIGNLPPSQADLEKQLFLRARQIAGESGAALVAQIFRAKGGSVELTRSIVELAAAKANPKQYLGAVLRGIKGDQSKPYHWSDHIAL